MKCHCPACGRSTEIDQTTLGFLTRCTRCGALLKAQLHEESGPNAIALKVIHPGRVRGGPSSDGTIADLLSRPLPARPPRTPTETVPPEPQTTAITADTHLYDLAPAPEKPATTIADLPIPQLPRKFQRRVALRERQQMLGMVTVFGLGLSALLAVGVLTIESRNIFLRSAHAHTSDIVQPTATPETPPATAPATP